MNTNKLAYWLQLILFSVIIAFLIPILFEWIQTRTLEITTRGIKDALFFGLLIPFIIFLSKNIRNDFFNVFLALLTIFFLFLLFRIGYLF